MKKCCKKCREVIEPGYKYITVPDTDIHYCKECVDDMSVKELLDAIQVDEYGTLDIMEFFEIEFEEETEEGAFDYGERFDCI